MRCAHEADCKRPGCLYPPPDLSTGFVYTQWQLDRAVEAEREACLSDIAEVQRNLGVIRRMWTVKEITGACDHQIRARGSKT